MTCTSETFQSVLVPVVAESLRQQHQGTLTAEIVGEITVVSIGGNEESGCMGS
jgi:hypothetical protein